MFRKKKQRHGDEKEAKKTESQFAALQAPDIGQLLDGIEEAIEEDEYEEREREREESCCFGRCGC